MLVKTHTLYFTIALLICMPLHAEESTAAMNAAEMQASEIELLEFIADWESNDGQWLEPSNFEKKALKENKNENENDRGDLHMTTTQEGHYDH